MVDERCALPIALGTVALCFALFTGLYILMKPGMKGLGDRKKGR